MKRWISQARPALCVIILIAFFLPAYKSYSAFDFVPLAMTEASGANGITTTDVLMLLLPLLLIPFFAILLIALFAFRISVKPVYLALPLVFSSFFLLLFFRSQGANEDALSISGLRVGFYLAAIAVALLPFTKDRKKKSRRKRKKIQAETTSATPSL